MSALRSLPPNREAGKESPPAPPPYTYNLSSYLQLYPLQCQEAKEVKLKKKNTHAEKQVRAKEFAFVQK